MKLKKSHVNINISLLILVLSLTVAGTINQSSKLQYNLETPKSSAGEITIITPENKTYTGPMSGYYPATYGFENDEDGTIPDEWEEVKGDPSILNEIIAELDGHKKVLHMDKGDTYGDNNYLNQYFKSIQEHGTIEFWGRTTDTSQESSWHLKSGSFGQYSIAGVRIMDSSFQFKNSSEWYPVPYNANSNQWYHIKIQFECGTGNNYGLAQYKWRFFINSVQFGDFQMISSHSNVSHIIIHQNWRYDNFHMYTDAVGYSWDSNYNIGDNLNEGILFSYENTTNLDWKGYSLDGQTNKTIMGNTTIPVPDDGLHSIHMFGNDSMGTKYESNLRYFTVDTNPYINIVTPENKTYTESMSGYYPATYGFESDTAGENPLFCPVEEIGGEVNVVDNVNGHNKVVAVIDNSGSDFPYFYNTFESTQTYGTYEYWVRTTDAFGFQGLRLYSGSIIDTNVMIDFFIQNGNFGYYDGSWHDITVCADNIWYHIEIAFDCTTGGYRGVNQYKFKVWINGTEYGEFGWWYSKSSADSVQFMGGNPEQQTLYIDAIGYSWDPNYNIGDNLNEGLLLSYDSNINFDWQGFSLDGQFNKTILGNTTIPIPNDGNHSIRVFGNDSIGTMYESDLRYFTTNALGPEITINSPISNQLFGIAPPDFSLSIPDSDLIATWYSLDGGTITIPFSGFTGTIDQFEWDKIGNGTATITFLAMDTAINIGQAEVTVRKDAITPVIIILEPTAAEQFVYTPIFEITIDEAQLYAFWYTIDNGLINHTIMSLSGTIDQTVWNNAPDGPVTIRFYARDDAGNIGTDSVIVAKIPSDLPSPPPGIPGYSLIALIGVTLTITLILVKRKLKK